jgi:hypothetical protein
MLLELSPVLALYSTFGSPALHFAIAKVHLDVHANSSMFSVLPPSIPVQIVTKLLEKGAGINACNYCGQVDSTMLQIVVTHHTFTIFNLVLREDLLAEMLVEA